MTRSINDPSLVSDTKECTKCNRILPKDKEHFPPRKLSKDGFDSWCRACHRSITKVWYAVNKEHDNKKSKEWRESNLDKRLEYDRKYHWNNREARINKLKAYVKKNPIKYREYGSRRRARLVSAEGSYTRQDVLNQHNIQNGLCFYCGTPLESKFQVDHYIPLSRGGTNWPSNIRIACPKCNLSKGAKMPDDFIKRINNNEV